MKYTPLILLILATSAAAMADEHDDHDDHDDHDGHSDPHAGHDHGETELDVVEAAGYH